MYYDIEVEIIKQNGKLWVYLANDGSSGCKYEFKTKKELKQIINNYVADLVDYEFDPDEVAEEEYIEDEE